METQQGNSGNGSTHSGELDWTQMPPTDEELMTMGEQAVRLLSSPAFNLAYRTVIRSLGEEMLMTEAHEARKRDAIHAEKRALEKVVWRVRAAVTEAEAAGERALQMEERAQYAQRARYQSQEPME